MSSKLSTQISETLLGQQNHKNLKTLATVETLGQLISNVSSIMLSSFSFAMKLFASYQ